jgi:hypothetical protein
MSLARLVPLRSLVPVVAVTAGLASAAPAQAASCIRFYAECLVQASELPMWWQRSSAGIDCYLDTVACLRGAYT